MSQPRTPAGTPVGGQFAASTHAEADGTLDVSSSEPTVECSNCDGTGVGSYGHACSICEGAGRVRNPNVSDDEIINGYLAANGYDDVSAWGRDSDYVELPDGTWRDENGYQVELRYQLLGALESSWDADTPEAELRDIARAWETIGDASTQFADTGQVTPDGLDAWHRIADQNSTDNSTIPPDLTNLIGSMTARAALQGTATSNETFLIETGMQPKSMDELNAMWDDYRAACNTEGPMRPDDWVYRHGRDHGAFRVPAPPVGTVIDEARARSLPGHTEIQATFEHFPEKSFRVMARDIARWDADPSDARLSRRFTNLDTGTEIFIGGGDTPDGYGTGHILTATVLRHG